MRIAYVAWVPGSAETGVLKKIAAQLRAWREAGHEVSLFTLGHGAEPWPGAADLAFQVYPVSSALSWFTQAERLARDALRMRPDLVYHRFNLYLPALERLFARSTVVVELNTLDLPEYRENMARARFAYHRVTRGRILRGASGFVAVTDEIARSVASYGKPTLVLGNGIDLDAVEPLPAAGADRASLVFMASRPDDAWHGLEKLVRLARSAPELDVHVVGKLDRPIVDPPSNLHAHGYLGEAQYRPLLARATAGVGPLALHLKHMDEACPLKTREYLALGLPVLCGHRDPDFPSGAAFLLELPNRPDNVARALPEIRAFVERWRGKRVDRTLIAHLDARDKERKRLAFSSSLGRH